jgi:hypothetical protein
MTAAVILIAVALLVMLAGGPSEFMRIVDHSVKAAVKYCAELYHGSRR